MPAAVPPSAQVREQTVRSTDPDRQLIDAQKELLSSTFSQAQAYTNVVVGAGYAGFFAVWAFTREQLTEPQVLWSALLMSMSLLVFIAFEVYKSFVTSQMLLGLARTLDEPSKFAQRLAAWKTATHHQHIRFGRIWASAFWIVVVTGFGAGLILFYSFVEGLIRWYAI